MVAMLTYFHNNIELPKMEVKAATKLVDCHNNIEFLKRCSIKAATRLGDWHNNIELLTQYLKTVEKSNNYWNNSVVPKKNNHLKTV
jgi:hypothetical protein